MQRVQIKESTSNRRMCPKIIIGEYEPKHITSVEFNIYPGEVPEFKFGTVGIPDIDVMGRVEINPSPTNLQEACRIVANELKKHGKFYDTFVASVRSSILEVPEDILINELAEKIVKRISGEE